MAVTEPRHDPYQALRHRDYRLFIAGRLLALMGVLMQDVAVGWQLYDRTHSAFALGLTGLASVTPTILFALPAGTMADRFDRRHSGARRAATRRLDVGVASDNLGDARPGLDDLRGTARRRMRLRDRVAGTVCDNIAGASRRGIRQRDHVEQHGVRGGRGSWTSALRRADRARGNGYARVRDVRGDGGDLRHRVHSGAAAGTEARSRAGDSPHARCRDKVRVRGRSDTRRDHTGSVRGALRRRDDASPDLREGHSQGRSSRTRLAARSAERRSDAHRAVDRSSRTAAAGGTGCCSRP